MYVCMYAWLSPFWAKSSFCDRCQVISDARVPVVTYVCVSCGYMYIYIYMYVCACMHMCMDVCIYVPLHAESRGVHGRWCITEIQIDRAPAVCFWFVCVCMCVYVCMSLYVCVYMYV
jgi:hypothetical protein